MIDFDAESRDAAYLAAQLQTNGVVIALKERMLSARRELRDIALEMDEAEGMGTRDSYPPLQVHIPVPALDRSTSRPMLPAPTGSYPAVTTYSFTGEGADPGE